MRVGVGAGSVDAHTTESTLGYAWTRGGPPARGMRSTSACGPAYATEGAPDCVLDAGLRSERPQAMSTSASGRREGRTAKTNALRFALCASGFALCALYFALYGGRFVLVSQ